MKKEFAPLLISISLLTISFAIDLSSDYSLNNKHIYASIILAITTFFFFKNKTVYFYAFTITLILGLFSIIDILLISFKISFGGSNFEVGINPLFILLTIIFLGTNRELINEMFPEKEISIEDVEKKKSVFEKNIKMYEAIYEAKSESELRKIAEEKSGYIEEAKIASKNILKKKYVL